MRIKNKNGTRNYTIAPDQLQAACRTRATADNKLGTTAQAFGDLAVPFRSDFYANPNITVHTLHGNQQPSTIFLDVDDTKGEYTAYCENPSNSDGMEDCSHFGAPGNNKSYALPDWGTGDGTAPLKSLTAIPLKWQKEGLKPVNVIPVKDTEHLAMLYDWRYISYVVGVVTGNATMKEAVKMATEPKEGALMRDASYQAWVRNHATKRATKRATNRRLTPPGGAARRNPAP